jgi:chromosome segregation ATPase
MRRYDLTIPLLAFLALTSCTDDVAAQRASDGEELERVQKAKAVLENEAKMLREDFEKKYNDILKQNDDLQKANDDLKLQLEKAQDEIEKAKRELQEHMAKYKVSLRQKAKGQQFPKLETADKRTFEGVTISELTASKVSFQHSAGVSTIDLKDLSPEWQRNFLYDPEEEKALAAAAERDDFAELEIVGITGPISPKADPIVVKRLRQRIVARQAEIKTASKEAREARQGKYGMTSLANLRVQSLNKRIKRAQEEIIELSGMLDKAMRGELR